MDLSCRITGHPTGRDTLAMPTSERGGDVLEHVDGMGASPMPIECEVPPKHHPQGRSHDRHQIPVLACWHTHSALGIRADRCASSAAASSANSASRRDSDALPVRHGQQHAAVSSGSGRPRDFARSAQARSTDWLDSDGDAAGLPAGCDSGSRLTPASRSTARKSRRAFISRSHASERTTVTPWVAIHAWSVSCVCACKLAISARRESVLRNGLMSRGLLVGLGVLLADGTTQAQPAARPMQLEQAITQAPARFGLLPSEQARDV